MSTGSWYGAQIGMTIWLLCLGVIGAVSLDWRLGLAHVVLFMVANVIGWVLWRCRGVLGSATGMLLFSICAGGIGLAAFLAMDAAGHLEFLNRPEFGGSVVRTIGVYPILLVFPVVGVLVWNKHRRRSPAEQP